MIIGDRVDEINAKIQERKEHDGINITMNIRDIVERDGIIEYHYVYNVEYKNVGYISLKGVLFGRDEPKEIIEEWKKNKKIDKENMERLLNVINYVGSIHCTLVANVISYKPPIMPLTLKIKEEQEEKRE